MGKLLSSAKNTVKKIAKTVLYGRRGTSEVFIRFLRSKGMRIGEGTTIYDPRTTRVDLTRPFLVDIGNKVKIAAGVTILTHGFDYVVLENKFGGRMGSAGKVVIKDNVFIGMNSTILKGVTVGTNVIIGANSLVNKDVPDNVVVAGNPAKVIMTIEEYYEKRKKVQVEEAKELALAYYERHNKIPPISIYRQQFAPVFTKSDWNPNPAFDGYEEFLKFIGLSR